jgi:hypothetical protein
MRNQGGNVTRPRAADDFDAIQQRIKELRRETAAAPPTETGPETPGEPPAAERERRFRDRREGLPPPWMPTIFLKRPASREIACRFWQARLGW